jgi:hypothetical protein
MVTIRAHFDGRVLVPDEPLNLPANQPLRVVVYAESDSEFPLAGLAHLAQTYSPVDHWPSDGAKQVDHYLYGTPKRDE